VSDAPKELELAAVVLAQTPVDTVTVTEDRAHVQRRGKVKLQAGVQRVRIEGVAPVVADKTLRVRASGGVNVGEAKVVRRVVTTEPEEQLAALQTELDRSVRELEVAAARVKRAQVEIALHLETQKRVLEELAEDAARGTMPAQPGALVRGSEELERGAREEYCVAQQQHKDLEAEIARLRQRLAKAGHKTSRVVAAVEVSVRAGVACEAELVVEYLVPGACWRPQHTATLRHGKLVVRTEGCVWQNTGESWDRVRLRFSTERPSLGQHPPELVDDEVAARRKSEVIRVEQRDEVVQHTGLGAGGGGDRRLPGIDDGGEVRVLEATASATVPSDGRPYRVPVASFEAPAEVSLVAMPELAEAVLLRAVQTNTGKLPLLAGPVDLVHEHGFVGATRVAYVAPGERFELGFGPDPHLRLHREVEAVDEEPGLLPSSWLGRAHRVRVHLSNLDTRARKLEVTERIPVSEIEKVEVSFDAGKTKPSAKPDEDGFLRWMVDLAPRGRTTLELRYVIKRHRDVAGL